jgi:hypothetical protein
MKLFFYFFALVSSLNGYAQSSRPAIEKWGRFEVTLNGQASGNPFTAVNLTATFTNGSEKVSVSGFYDGEGKYLVRFMPYKEGRWSYTTSSNSKPLHGKKGDFDCIAPSGQNHGPVTVRDTYNFKYADGTPYYPVGTTAYAWNHMQKPVQELTLQTLRNAGFNKLRMAVFPKDYNLVKEEPEIYPFVATGSVQSQDGTKRMTWDFNSFDPAFFRVLEKQIDELDKLGIQADLILFHPYDKGRWGFDSLTMDVNLRYIHYIVARLSSFRNVWWSMANEYDYVTYKTHDDWITLTKAVHKADPYRHLLSIHGSTGKYFHYWLPEFTHVSIQDEGPVSHWGAAVLLRNAYYKPVIYDEVGYEGNLASRWGRYSGEEMNYLMWMGIIGGTYVTHGESYMFKNEKDTIFWAKGGEFKGTSWQRAGFLKKILEEGPGPLEPADAGRDFKTATAGKGYYLMYFGKEINDHWVFNLPQKNGPFSRLDDGKKFTVEIIDTWNMTVTPVQAIFETSPVEDYRLYDKERKKIRLPMRPYLAIRITEIRANP